MLKQAMHPECVTVPMFLFAVLPASTSGMATTIIPTAVAGITAGCVFAAPEHMVGRVSAERSAGDQGIECDRTPFGSVRPQAHHAQITLGGNDGWLRRGPSRDIADGEYFPPPLVRSR